MRKGRAVSLVVGGAVVGLAACGPRVGAASALSYVRAGEPAVWPAGEDAPLPRGPDSHPSPDGTRWLEGSFYALTLHDALTGETVPVAEGEAGREIIPESVAWSPDGRQLAFLQFDLSGYRVQVVALDGLRAQSIELASGHAGSQLAWLDESRLAYSDLDRLVVYDVETGEGRDLGEGRQPLPSPDGSLLAFERVSDVAPSGCAAAVGVGVVGSDGGAWRVLLDEAGRFASLVGWSEGGRALIVLSRPIDCNASQPPLPDRLLRLDMKSGALDTLSTRDGGPWPLVLLAADPASDRVAFVTPGCDPLGDALTTQQVVVSPSGHPDRREVVAEVEAPGCAFSTLRWLPPPVARPGVDYGSPG